MIFNNLQLPTKCFKNTLIQIYQGSILNYYHSIHIVLEYNSTEKMKVVKASKGIVAENNYAQSITNNLSHKTDLKKIIELTEQYDPNPPAQSSQKRIQSSKVAKHTPKMGERLKSYVNCLSNLWRYICYRPDSFELDANDPGFINLIASIKNKKKQYNSVLPAQKEKRKVLVLDLDETLIHTTFSRPEQFDFQSQVTFNGKPTKIYTVKRFGIQAFIFEMSKIYEIVVFTASQRHYADKIINSIDPKNRISHRLYRQHCIVANKSYYLKNLNILGRNIKDVIIVDDNSIAGVLQPDNFYQIQPFEGNDKDRQLCRLSAFLKHIHPKKDILPIREQRKKFEEMEINLQEEAIIQIKAQNIKGRSLIQRKKQYRHKKKNSEIENLVVSNSEAQTEAQTTASDFIKKL